VLIFISFSALHASATVLSYLCNYRSGAYITCP